MAIDLKPILSNPWVLGGGAALGVVILLMSNTGRGGSTPGYIDPNALLSLNELQAGQAKAGQDYSANMAEIAAGLSGQLASLRTSENISIVNALSNMNAVIFAAGAQQQETMAGVARSRIESQTALVMDRNQNRVRLETSYVAADTSKFMASRDVEKTEVAANAANFNSILQSQSAALAAVLGFAGNVVGAVA